MALCAVDAERPAYHVYSDRRHEIVFNVCSITSPFSARPRGRVLYSPPMVEKELIPKPRPSRFRQLLRTFLLLGCLVVAFPFVWQLFVHLYAVRFTYDADTVPTHRVAIVFGAGIYADGRLTAVLEDRMMTAIALYEQGKLDKILVSGDNRTLEYDEPTAMLNFALDQGVAAADVQPDYAGWSTYDTCYRARHIFQVEEAIVITQEFHLSRAILTCRQLGITAVGVAADRQSYARARWFAVREIGATFKALLELIRHQPAPIMGDPIPIE